MIVLSDTGFHAAEGGSQQSETVSTRGEWQDRMLVETVLDDADAGQPCRRR